MIKLAYPAALAVSACFFSQALGSDLCKPGNGFAMKKETNAPWIIKVDLSPGGVPLNAPFNANVAICSVQNDGPARMSVDATMPAHKHGMNYVSTIVENADNAYLVENLLFHMPGVWRLEITAYEDEMPHRYTHDLKVR